MRRGYSSAVDGSSIHCQADRGIVKLPDVPVTVTVAAPVLRAVRRQRQDACGSGGFVPNVAVTPFGTPVADKVTLPEKAVR